MYKKTNTDVLRRREKSAHSSSRVICRVSNNRERLKEDNFMKAFHAFLLSHIIYGAPLLKLTKKELNKSDDSLSMALKRVLNLPKCSSYSSDCITQQRSSLKLNEQLIYGNCHLPKKSPRSSQKPAHNPSLCHQKNRVYLLI